MFTELNKQQKEAMLEIEKPVLILAGAGSGKTKVITNKVAYLILEHNYNPWSILAVTFTNKAANEMKSRVLELLEVNDDDNNGNEIKSNSFWISTFHSICGRILRSEIEVLGYKTNFTIYDTEDSKKLIGEIMTKLNISKEGKRDTNYMQSYISRCKNQMISAEDLSEEGELERDNMKISVAKVYRQYEISLFENNAIDFDNMILKVIELFEKFPDVLEKYRNRFKYVLVDEFQDTNLPQYKLIKQLLGNRLSISVVGDDDQSIYSWRGAEIGNILSFNKDFQNSVIIKLEQNYRSTNNILSAAHSVVVKNKNRMDKKLWSQKGEGEKIKFYSCYDDTDEGKYVVRKIKELVKQNEKQSEIAVFYRTNAQSRILEDLLRKDNINYKIFGGIKFYERREIKDLLAYFTVINNEDDSISIKRIINIPKRGIGDTTIHKIDEIADQYRISFYSAIKYCLDNGLIPAARSKLVLFLELIEDLKLKSSEMKLSELFDYVFNTTKYVKHLESEEDFKERLENLNEFKRALMDYEENEELPSLDGYLTQVALQTTVDDHSYDKNYVTLMTLHNSKGLEFNNVFIVGMNEEIFPSWNSRDNKKELEEERRLFYVGITRAKIRCFLSSAERRFYYGRYITCGISRFVSEIDTSYIENDEIDPYGANFKAPERQKKAPAKIFAVARTEDQIEPQDKNLMRNIEDIHVNDTLYHSEFGQCKVIKINPKGIMSTLLLEFKDGNRGLYMLKYVKLYKDPELAKEAKEKSKKK